MSGAVSRWLGSVDGLTQVAERLLRVQIENSDALEVIKRYDRENTLFYCDPPYPPEIRGDIRAYGYEMDAIDHRKLANVLRNCKGKVALSGYKCGLLDELYHDWDCTKAPIKNCQSVKRPRQEVLYVNYEISHD
jgi:DNA adenine methylase